MNNILNKLERRFGRYAIPDLIRYVIVLYCGGAVLGMLNQDIYYNYLSLNFEAIFHGQIWRLFTYLIEPYGFSSGMGFIISILFFAIQVNLFFLFGRSLEQAWGTFRFNMYFVSGYLLNIIAALILYLSPLHATVYASGFQYIYWSMFFAFAAINPDMQFLLYFVIPIKVKWLAVLDAVYMLYQVGRNFYTGIYYAVRGGSAYADITAIYISMGVAIIVSMGNFLIYFFASRNYHRISPSEMRRKRQFRRKVQEGRQQTAGGTRHRCAVCGRTEVDAPDMDFRYCSKCEGNYEYCSEHLFTHQHVKKFL